MKNITSILVFITCLFQTLNSFAQTFPKEKWSKIEHPDFYGWSSEQLVELREYVIDSTATTGMMIIHHGKVVYDYGNITENSYIASCRKSIMAMLYGKHVANGTIDLNETMADLGIDKSEQLLDIEKTATVKDIISARSGIFLPASNPGDMQQFGPKRGTVKPGEFWLYNNWDFNMAGHIFELKTKRNIYDEIESQFAIPLNMQDWDRSIQEKSGDLFASDHLAYHIWFSVRDMARIGLLMLNEGRWGNDQIMEEKWVKEMTTPKSSFEDLEKVYPFYKNNGVKLSYGYMWWLWETPEDDIMNGAYSAQGAWGQNITVVPKMDLVIVIKTNDLYERRRGDHYYMIDQIVKAYHPKTAESLSELAKALEEPDIAPFVKAFQKQTHPKDLLDYTSLINNMGYYYVEKKEYTEALKLFELNVDRNPESWNVYDSQGEAYLLLKDYTKSLEAYQKAISLNLQNQYNNNERVEYICKRIRLKLLE